VSDTDSFVFPLANFSDVEDAIKFNISNYNIHYFNSINEIASFLEAENIASQKSNLLPAQARWTYVTRDENPTQMAIVPYNPPDILFRGQVKRYEPCFSAATRGVDAKAIRLDELNDRDQARLILNVIKTQWFVELLRQTSPLRWMSQEKLFINEIAIAQHYGLPTGYVDLTQSFEVATFFACCKYDDHSKRWEPATSGEGVIYTIDWRKAPFQGPIRPIYLQVFPRPSEQWGWTHELRLGQDFDKLPYVTKLIFKHDEGLSSKILQHFRRGEDLFPPDPLSTLAERIMNSKVIPRVAAAEAAQDFVEDPQGLPGRTVENIIEMIARETGVIVADEGIPIGVDQIDSEMEKVWNERKESFSKNVTKSAVIRLVRTKRIP
jgi:hypothetical protein